MSGEQITVLIGEKKYPVIKRGRAQAEQLVRLTGWLSKYGRGIYQQIRGLDESSLETASIIEIILDIAGGLDVDSLIDLFMVATGCTKEEADEYFDIGILVETGMLIYENQPAVKRVVNRFFSDANSMVNTEESPTTSEEPTDGPTTK